MGKKNDRYNRVIDLLYEDGTLSVPQLAEICKVSEMTIRRDLEQMQDDNLLTRTHGGARINKTAIHEIAYKIKTKQNVKTKQMLAQEAIKLITDGQTVYLDAGTTNYELAKLIVEDFSTLNVVTNDINICKLLCSSHNVVFLVGGIVDNDTECSVGNMALEMLKQFSFDMIFMASSTMTNDYYIGTSSESKLVTKEYLFSTSAKKVLLIDETKMGKRAVFKIANIDKLDAIVTDIDLTSQKELLENIEYIKI